MIRPHDDNSYPLELEIDGIIVAVRIVTSRTYKINYALLVQKGMRQKKPWAVFLRVRRVQKTHINVLKRKQELQTI
jgi:hypothetical protein